MSELHKKYTILLIIFFIAVIMMSGCVSKPKTQQIVTQAAFVGGTEGLKISLLPNMPPQEIYTGQNFQIAVQIENKGEGTLAATDISPSLRLPYPPPPSPTYGYISLAGINTGAFNINSSVVPLKTNLSPTKKVGKTIIPGGQTQQIFDATAPKIEGAQAQFPLYVSILYSYTSKAIAPACLKQNPYQQTLSGKEICKIVETKPVESSGAPVKVTSVEEVSTGFKIRVKNVGSGYPFIYESGKFPTKESEINQYNQKDRVEIASVKLGETDITSGCTLSQLYLVNNEAEFFCNADLTGATEAVEQLVIELKYGYISTISTKFTILSIPS